MPVRCRSDTHANKEGHLAMKLICTLVAMFAATTAAAQEGPIVSPPAARTTFSADIDALVEKAYPAYDASIVAQRLQRAARELAARRDTVKPRSLGALERLMGFAPGAATSVDDRVDTPTAFYRVDPGHGVAAAFYKDASHLGLSREAFKAIESRVAERHLGFLATVGLPADELMRVDFLKLMAQSTVEGSPDNSDGTPAVVRKGLTKAHRGYRGFPIDGSFARLGSFDERRIEELALVWPKVEIHPGLTSFALDSDVNVKRAIAERVKAATRLRGAVAVSMGIVFRPAKTREGRLVHLPAMKVFVIPQAKPQAGGRSEVLTEAGEVFYAQLLRQELPIADEGVTD